MLQYALDLIETKQFYYLEQHLQLLTMYIPFSNFFVSIWVMIIRFSLQCTRLVLDTFLDALGLFYPAQRNRLPPITNPLLLQSATELTSKIRSGHLKCETLLKAFVDRIKQVNPLINAVVHDCFEQAFQEAKDYDRRIEKALMNSSKNDNVLQLPLLGIPVTIKECIAVKGLPITAGLYSRKNVLSEEDAPTVVNLRKSGAIIIGTTNVPEFLLWWDTNNRLYGRTNNPYDLSRISGGSSGGEAAILSSGGSVIGLGSDIGGSIRIPTFFCGLFGHKPSSHLTDLSGVYPYCGHPTREKFFVIGPICRYAIDLKLVLKQIIGDNKTILSELQLDKPVDLKKSKFYFLYNDGDPAKTPVSHDLRETMEKVRIFFEKDCGYNCNDVTLPLMRYNFFIWLTTLADCDAPTLGEEVMERKGKLNGWKELLKSFFGMSNFRKITCMNVIGEDLLYSQKLRQTRFYRNIVNKGVELRKELDKLLDNDSVLILPCLPEKAPKHNGTYLRMNNIGYTSIFNILEFPVTQVALGIGNESKMPVGFQIVSKRLNDRVTLAVAELLAKEFGGWIPPCDVTIKAKEF